MMRKRIISLITIATIAVATAGCGSSKDSSSGSSSTSIDKVKVGIIPIVDVAPIYLGKAQGFFTKNRIDLTLQQAQGGAAIVPAVVSGQYQFGFSNVVSLMLAESQNVPIKAVANGNNATTDKSKDFGMLVVKDPSVTSAKQLVGKTVATNTLKNIVDTSVKDIVQKDGGDPSQVKFVELGFPDMAAALDADRVQGAFLVEPFLSAALAKGWHTVGSFADVQPALTISAYFTSQQEIAKNSDLVSRFTAAMEESLAYADANPDAVKQIVTTYTTIKADQAAKMTLPKFSTEIDKSSLDTMNQLMVQQGLLKSAVDTSKLLP
jgi:NitT/TauT family transport system substrate-binding protein